MVGHLPGENEEVDFDEDPHAEDHGYYDVPVVDLVASCSGDYDPEALLAWVPAVGAFGTWDASHLPLLVFPGVSWTEIAGDPLRYVNAQWSDETPGHYLAPWVHGFPWRDGSAW